MLHCVYARAICVGMAKTSKHYRLSDPTLDAIDRLRRKLPGRPPATGIIEDAVRDYAKKHGVKVAEVRE